MTGCFRKKSVGSQKHANMNRQISSKEIRAVIKKNIPIKKGPKPDGFMGGFYQTFTGELTAILLKHF